MSATEVRRDVSALDFTVELFETKHLPALARFCERYWVRPRTDAFYEWRYVQSLPFSRMFLALADGECLGLVCAFLKQYLIDGQPTPILEIFDWHALPGLKGSGVGLRVMRAMTRQGHRLIGIGGTADVQKALPAMGWQTLGGAMNYELPVSGEALDTALRARVPFKIPGARLVLDAVAAAWFRPRIRHREGRVIPVATLGDEIDSLYRTDTGYDLVQVPSRAQFSWMTSGYPGTGGFQYWYVEAGGRLVGWMLTRLYQSPEGLEAAIVDVFVPETDAALLPWMVTEAAVALAAARPRVIRARATCPRLQAALVANRFRPGTASNVYTWPKFSHAPERLHVTLNHTDAAMRPYPSGRPGEFSALEDRKPW